MDFGIDIVYADADGTITSIHHAPAPGPGEDGSEQEYPGRGQYVFEVNYEWTAENNVAVGDRLVFERAPAQLVGKRGEGFKYMLTLMNKVSGSDLMFGDPEKASSIDRWWADTAVAPLVALELSRHASGSGAQVPISKVPPDFSERSGRAFGGGRYGLDLDSGEPKRVVTGAARFRILERAPSATRKAGRGRGRPEIRLAE